MFSHFYFQNVLITLHIQIKGCEHKEWKPIFLAILKWMTLAFAEEEFFLWNDNNLADPEECLFGSIWRLMRDECCSCWLNSFPWPLNWSYLKRGYHSNIHKLQNCPSLNTYLFSFYAVIVSVILNLRKT